MEIIQKALFGNNISAMNIEILEMAHARLDPEWRAENIRSDFTRVYAVLAGEGLLRGGGKRVEMRPGGIYVVPAGLSFSYGCDGFFEKEYYHIRMRQPDGRDFFDGLGRIAAFEGRGDEVSTLCGAQNDIGGALRVKQVLFKTALDCLALLPAERQGFTAFSPLTAAALKYIGENLSARLTAETIAAGLFVSKSLLQRRFKEETGASLGRYVSGRLMSAAEQELRGGTRSIGEISEALGFCDQFYFSRRFAQTHGLPPQEYRHTVFGGR